MVLVYRDRDRETKRQRCPPIRMYIRFEWRAKMRVLLFFCDTYLQRERVRERERERESTRQTDTHTHTQTHRQTNGGWWRARAVHAHGHAPLTSAITNGCERLDKLRVN